MDSGYHKLKQMREKIVVVGSSNTDMVVHSQRLPSPGETVLGGEFLMNAGGKGANQAVAAARLGAHVVFIGCVGNDIFGQKALRDLSEEGIDIRYLKKDPRLPSGVALIMVDEKGENSISVASGANNALFEADIDRSRSGFAGCKFLLMQMEVPLKTIAYAAEWAAKQKIKVILNPAPAQPLPHGLYRSLFVITPNEKEAELLTGITVTDSASAGKAAKELCGYGVRHVIITMGSKGAFVFDDGGGRMVRAPEVKAVDTTAAGDTFNGALAVALAEGAALDDAVSFANEAAALSVLKLGAQSSVPFRKELTR
jgi:ribokinase